VRDWVIGSLQIKASRGRIQQRGDDDKRIDLRVSGETSVGQEVYFDAFKQRRSKRVSEFPTGFHAALLLGHSPCQEENQVPVFLIHLGK